jgi:tight adherence protein C
MAPVARVWLRVLRYIGRRPWAGRVARVGILQRRLELAGVRMTLDAAIGTEVLLGMAGGACTLLFGLMFPPALLLSPVAALVAARTFDLVVARRARRRQERIAASVPDLVELLVATTDAGMNPPIALRRTAPMLRDLLGAELTRVVSEVELGLPWQRAVERMVDRTDVPSLRLVAAALCRSQQLGTALGSTLRLVAEDLRRERRTDAEEQARKAPIKMLFPLVFLILPAFLLLTVGPAVLATLRSLQSGG